MVFCRFTVLDTCSRTVSELGPRFERVMDSGSVCTPTLHVLVVVGGISVDGAALFSNTGAFEVRNCSNKSEASLAVI